MAGISQMGRYAQGVKLINIREDDSVATVSRCDKNEEQDEMEDMNEEPGSQENGPDADSAAADTSGGPDNPSS